MKVCVAVHPPHLSRGIHRVAHALTRYAPPSVHVVPTWDEADHVLLHVVGWEDVERCVDTLRDAGRTVSIFQYCLLTTSQRNLQEWWRVWAKCQVVVSYYDLAYLCSFRSLDLDYPGTVNFLHTPLGVDTTVFKPCGCGKQFVVGTSGTVAGSECLNEWAEVASSSPLGHFHLGPAEAFAPEYRPRVTAQTGMGDVELAKRWSRCVYVSGLRRGEGFELPAYEGLACGARPVMFNRVDARGWLGSAAEYIEEGSDGAVIDQLRALLTRPARPVTAEERAWAAATFRWETLARKWWAAVGVA